jgi:pimeloyl-ACP methyl ester carboxylesterase
MDRARGFKMSVWIWMVVAVAAVLLLGALTTDISVRRLEAAHRPTGLFVETSTGRVHLTDRGPADAPAHRTVVLIHGASGSLLDMELALGRHMPPDMRVIAVDRPGLGWSERPTGAHMASPAAQAAMIAEALRTRGVRQAIIVGHSWAGAVALNFALDQSDLVAGLLLLAPVSHPWPGGVTWYYYPATTPVVGDIFIRSLVYPLASLIFERAVDGVFAPQVAPCNYAEDTAARLILRPKSFKANAQDVRYLLPFIEQQSTRYGDIRVPTAIVSGTTDDVVWTKIHSHGLRREIAGAILTELPDVGHMPHHVATDIVLDQLARLSARIQAAPTAAELSPAR